MFASKNVHGECRDCVTHCRHHHLIKSFLVMGAKHVELFLVLLLN
jgi:hypothetical protein